MCLKPILRVIFCLLCLTISTLSGLAQSGSVTIRTVAGNGTSGWVGTGGPATSAPLYFPTGVAVDAAGNLYIADYFVHKVTPGGLFNRDLVSPEGGAGGVAVDAAGKLFTDDNGWSMVFKVPCCRVAGTGTGALGFSGDGGPATSALLNLPTGLAVDAAGNLYIADTGNHRVRKVTPGGIISTVAGNGSLGFSGDGGPAAAAQLNFPTDVAVDAAGSLYITDSNNRVRKVTPEGVIGTVAGNGTLGFSGDGGPATSAQLHRPAGIAVDAAGNLYIADSYNNRVRMVTPEGVIGTVAGNGIAGFSGDGGPAASAQLHHPSGVAVDAAGNLFIADTNNYRVRKVEWSPARTEVQIALNSTRYCVGSSWNLKVSNAAPHAAIRLFGTVNDTPWETPHWADTDGAGNFSASGTYAADDHGRYTLGAEIEGSRSNILPVEILKCGVRDAGSLNVGRAWPTATLLANGKVLVIGWTVSPDDRGGAELYDPVTETWSVTGKLVTPRVEYTATLLSNGKVLVTGGFAYDGSGRLNSAELYDPQTGTWTLTGSLNAVRGSHTATLLPNGQVLVAAGDTSCCFDSPPVSELYDPGTGTWRVAGRLTYNGHLDQRATLLADGRVLFVGGIDNRESYPSSGGAALYDPATETWRTTRSPGTPRANHTATLLPNGKVLVVGGFIDLGLEAPAETYDPATETWSDAGILSPQRSAHTATLLPNGKVLFVGNIFGPTGIRTYGTWSYDPDTRTWSDFVPHDEDYHTATMLQSGKVLMVGGWRSGALKGTALYDGGVEIPLLTLNSAKYCVGASWDLLTIRAARSASVRLLGVSNGVSWQIPRWGITNEGGTFSASGNMAGGTEGTHSLRVEIGGVWSNTIDFSVSKCQP